MKIILATLLTALSSFLYSQNVSRIESRQSLYIELYKSKQYLGCATAFIVYQTGKPYLVTSYHALTNTNPATGKRVSRHQPAPDRIAIFHNATEEGKYVVRYENLWKGKKRRLLKNYVYIHHKRKLTDVAEVPLSDTAGIQIIPVNVNDSASYNYSSAIAMASFPMAIKTLHTSSPPSPGLINTFIPVSDSSILGIWLNEKQLVEMSGAPLFVSNNNTLGKTYNAQIIGHTGEWVGMYAKMPELPSDFIKSFFIGWNLERITGVRKAEKVKK